MAANALITRRNFLRAVPPAMVVGTALVAPVAADILVATDAEQIQEHIEAIKVIMRRLHPDRDEPDGFYRKNHHGGMVLVMATTRYIQFDGAGLYEVNEDGKGPVYFVKHAYSSMDRVKGYHYCDWWKGKQQSPYQFATDLKFVRKIDRDI